MIKENVLKKLNLLEQLSEINDFENNEMWF